METPLMRHVAMRHTHLSNTPLIHIFKCPLSQNIIIWAFNEIDLMTRIWKALNLLYQKAHQYDRTLTFAHSQKSVAYFVGDESLRYPNADDKYDNTTPDDTWSTAKHGSKWIITASLSQPMISLKMNTICWALSLATSDDHKVVGCFQDQHDKAIT